MRSSLSINELPGKRVHGARYRRGRMILPGTVCSVCGSTEDLQVDHIIPIGLGGTDSQSNWQVLCKTCHKAKGDISTVKKAHYADPEKRASTLGKFYAAFPNGFSDRQQKIGKARKRRWDQTTPERRAEIGRAVAAGLARAPSLGAKCEADCKCKRHKPKFSVTCHQCGIEFFVNQSGINRERKFCSPACSYQSPEWKH